MPRLSIFAMLMLTASPALADSVRVATFNASLNRETAGGLAEALAAEDTQITNIAQIIAEVAPDILLINEFDYQEGLIDQFVETYLDPEAYPYRFAAPSNTGIASGIDLNGDGDIVTEPGSFEYANDAFGFGLFPGQYGMAVISRHPIDMDAVRTFQTFLWADMPDAQIPMNEDDTPFYSEEAWSIFRLSSKSHWDLPIQIGESTLHLLASHPTPPVFDGPEDRNGTRNADEIRFWADYIQNADYIYDDAGGTGGLAEGAHFVIAGDLNADPFDGDSADNAIGQLLDLPLITTDPTPESEGGLEAAEQGGANDTHLGNPAFDTADFGDDPDRFGPGNLRVDYVLPSATLTLEEAGVHWPASDEGGAGILDASDHRLVWIDVTLP